MIPIPDAEARLYRLLAELVDGLGVPAYAAGAAIGMIREGRPVREAADFCLDAIGRKIDEDLLTRAATISPGPPRRRARARG